MRFQLSFFLDHVLMPSWPFTKQECVYFFFPPFYEFKRWHSFFLGCLCMTITSNQHTFPQLVLALENKASQFLFLLEEHLHFSIIILTTNHPPHSIFYYYIKWNRPACKNKFILQKTHRIPWKALIQCSTWKALIQCSSLTTEKMVKSLICKFTNAHTI